MTTDPSIEDQSLASAPDAEPAQEIEKRTWPIALTSFLFVLLQSACTAIMAISGLRLLIGLGSLAAASTGVKLLVSLHFNAIRIPMLVISVVGSLINLYVIWRLRSLRARPSSAWRVEPASPKKLRDENIQIAIAILTLILVIAEMIFHISLHGSELA